MVTQVISSSTRAGYLPPVCYSLLLIIIFVATVGAEEIDRSVWVSGIVRSAETDSTLGFSNVVVSGSRHGGMADESGRFAFAMPSGSHTIKVLFMGYQPWQQTIVASPGDTLIIEPRLTENKLPPFEPRTIEREYETVNGERHLLDPFRGQTSEERRRNRDHPLLHLKHGSSWTDSANALGLLPARKPRGSDHIFLVADIISIRNLDLDFYENCFSAEYRATDSLWGASTTMRNLTFVELEPVSILAGDQLPDRLLVLTSKRTPISGMGIVHHGNQIIAPGQRILGMLELDGVIDFGYPFLRSAFSLGVPGHEEYRRALLAPLTGLFHSAADSIRAGITAGPRRPSDEIPLHERRDLTGRAMQAYCDGEWAKAEILCGERIRQAPDDGEAFFYLAMTYSMTHRYREAKGAFLHAMILDPARAQYAKSNIESNFAMVFNKAIELLSRGEESKAL